MSDFVVNHATIATIDPAVLYKILTLRLEVFGDEQGIAWRLDFDTVDIQPETHHLWIERNGSLDSYLRLARDSEVLDQWKLGRVVTRQSARGLGLASALNLRAIVLANNKPVRITAEEYLRDWYAGFGFVATGKEMVIAEINHVEMVLTPE